jgi:hypothetical protein
LGELKTVLDAAVRLPTRLRYVFVDDGSNDGSLEILRQLHAADPRHVRVLSFRRTKASRRHWRRRSEAQGDAVVTLDADLQTIRPRSRSPLGARSRQRSGLRLEEAPARRSASAGRRSSSIASSRFPARRTI